MRTVVVLGDGAEWIWHAARAFLGLPDVELVEIIDLYHAYESLWALGNAVLGAETAAAAAWVEPLKTRRYEEGAAPLHAALLALARTVAPAAPAGAAESDPAAAVRRALEDVTGNAARLDYPAFIARQWPIGSGAVESGCKSVVQARTKGAGLRWSGGSGDGAQQVGALRALHRSGRWDAFWPTQPQRAHLLLFPRTRRPRVPLPVPAPPSVRPVADPPAPAPVAAPPPPRPLRPAADHPWRRQPIGRPRSA